MQKCEFHSVVQFSPIMMMMMAMMLMSTMMMMMIMMMVMMMRDAEMWVPFNCAAGAALSPALE